MMRPVFARRFLHSAAPIRAARPACESCDAVMHGNVYAAMKVGPPMSSRAAGLGRIAAFVYLIAFIAAGLWVSGLDGLSSLPRPTASATSNPLHKGVALVHGGWLANYRAHAVLWVLPVARSWPRAQPGTCSGASLRSGLREQCAHARRNHPDGRVGALPLPDALVDPPAPGADDLGRLQQPPYARHHAGGGRRYCCQSCSSIPRGCFACCAGA